MFTEPERRYLHSVASRDMASLDNIDLTGISERQYNLILERRARKLGQNFEFIRKDLNSPKTRVETPEEVAARLSL